MMAWMFLSTCGERSEAATVRSMKSGPGRMRSSFGIPLHSCSSSDSASSPSKAWMSTVALLGSLVSISPVKLPRVTLDELIELGDLDELVREIDRVCERRDWAGLVRLRDRSRAAVSRGKQLWPAASLAEYRLALEAPGRFAAVAHERVVRGENLVADARVPQGVFDPLPLALLPWEPAAFPLATYAADGVD